MRNGTWRVRLRVFPVMQEREVADGSGQQMPDVRERWSTGGAQEAVAPDFDEAFWQDMLEEASDEFFCGKRSALPLVACALLEAEGDVPVFKLFNAVVGDSNAPDVGGKVGDDLVAGAGGFTVGDPWLAPDVGGHVTEQGGLGECLLELPTEDGGEGSYRHKPVIIAG